MAPLKIGPALFWKPAPDCFSFSGLCAFSLATIPATPGKLSFLLCCCRYWHSPWLPPRSSLFTLQHPSTTPASSFSCCLLISSSSSSPLKPPHPGRLARFRLVPDVLRIFGCALRHPPTPHLQR